MADKKDKKSTSPGPHGVLIVQHRSKTTPIRFKPIKTSNRAKLLPLIEKKKFKRFEKKDLKSGRQEGLASEGRTPKARKLTSLMRKGYRKGYRVKSTRGGSRR
jgi:hypothetical protein